MSDAPTIGIRLWDRFGLSVPVVCVPMAGVGALRPPIPKQVPSA